MAVDSFPISAVLSGLSAALDITGGPALAAAIDDLRAIARIH